MDRITKIGALSTKQSVFVAATADKLQEFTIFADWYEECSHKGFRIDAGHMVLVECHRF